MTIKKKVPRSSCYMSSTVSGESAMSFELLEGDDEDEEDEESDDEESAADESEEDEDDSESEEEAAAESDGDEGDDEPDDDDEESAGDEKASAPKGSFQMLAHTGKLISRWWGHLVLDMDGAKYQQRVALIKDHDTSQPLGFSTSIKRTPRGIEAVGQMLKGNAAAEEVTSYSKQGYPWQASLMAVPSRVEEVEPGAATTVNGREVLGPVTIFREWTMHELTLTTLGADDDTTTEAFAAEGEIEVEIMAAKKKNPRQATQNLSPQSAAPTAVLNPGEAEERSRVNHILSSADPSQMEMAQELISSGAPLSEALASLNADLRERLSVAKQGLTVAAEPLSGGNTGGRDGAGLDASSEKLDFDAMPDDPEQLGAEWDRSPRLHSEFDNKATFLAWGRNRHRCIHMGSNVQMSEKLAGGLKGIGHRNVQGRYFMRYDDKMAKLWTDRLVTATTTDQDHEVYKWLGNAPAPKKFEGERQRRSLTDYGLTVVGEKYENTVEVDIDDLRRDKTGQAVKRIGELGTKMASLNPRLITNLLVANGTAYDGLPLYSNSHEVRDSGVQSNDESFTVVNPDEPTPTELSVIMLKMIQNMLEQKDEDGEPINEDASKFFFLTPTKYLNVLAQAVNMEYLGNGVSNAIKSSSFSIDFATNGRFSGAASAAGRRIYCFREDAEIRSLIWQEENLPDGFKSQDAYSPDGFWRDKVAFGAKRIAAVAPGRFELTRRGTLTA